MSSYNLKIFTFSKLFLLMFVFQINAVLSKSIPEGYYHSDAIVTKWPTGRPPIEKQNSSNSFQQNDSEENSNEPGWLRKQLLRFGQVASKIGNAMGGHANKISAALDKICEVVKTVIPLLAAVCHVGEFGFCTATNEAPIKLVEAMNPSNLNLNVLDR